MSESWVGDAIVIGSGFGGSVAACRLAEAGASVLVLERGRRWEPDEYPRDLDDPWLYDSSCPERLNGWLEFHIFRNMIVATGAGVGGGSLVYANVSAIPPAQRFEQGWPREITREALLPYYERVGRMLAIEQIPDGQLTKRFQLVRDAARAAGFEDRLFKMDLAVRFNPDWNDQLPDPYEERHSRFEENAFGKRQGTCIHLGMCDVGCPVQAKNTLDLNYLAMAEANRAVIKPLRLVREIVPEDGGYRVWFKRVSETNRTVEDKSAWAQVVVLGAGSIGSTELLLRARRGTLPLISDFVGRDWSANGNFLTPGIYKENDPKRHLVERELNPTYGPTITGGISFLDGEASGGYRYTVEEGGAPPVLRGYLQQRLGAKAVRAQNWRTKLVLLAIQRHLRNHEELEHVMPWFANGVDGADGRLFLGRRWLKPWERRLKMRWQVTKSEKVINAIISRHRELCEKTGGRIQVPPTWRFFRDLITPHPLGGCNMAESPEKGVVDHTGKVFGYEGLYVLDGAVVPEAIGINPSRTIAALAERNVRYVIEAVGKRPPAEPWAPPGQMPRREP